MPKPTSVAKAVGLAFVLTITLSFLTIQDSLAASMSISASPVTVETDGSSTITWSTTGMDYCGLYAGSTYVTAGTMGSVSTGALKSSRTYGLDCYENTNTPWQHSEVTVKVSASAPSMSLSASPTSVATGESSTITWSTTGMAYCGLYAGDKYVKAGINGSISTGSLSKNTKYNLDCYENVNAPWQHKDITVKVVEPAENKNPNGTQCSAASDCTSGYCYPGPNDQKYCIAAEKNCAKPDTDGVLYGTNYSYNNRTYACVAGTGLIEQATKTANGNICSANTECSSGYCYPGPNDQKYCIAAEKNCAKPDTDGVLYGTSYVHDNNTYSCVAGTGLVGPPLEQTGSRCQLLFKNSFVMGGYSGGLGSGNIITPDKMKEDGWNVDGPHYAVKTFYYDQDYINELIENDLCTIYTAETASSDPDTFYTATADGGSSNQALRQRYLDTITKQVKEALANPDLNELISAWYILPEEIGDNQPNNADLIRDQYNAIKELDPLRRPIFSYMPGDATIARASGVGPYHDVILIGQYLGYDWNRAQILFGAEASLTVAAAYGNQVPMMALQMYQSYVNGVWQDPGQSEFPPHLSRYMSKFVRHDVFAAIAKGMKGFLVFSFANRVNFTNYSEYYNAYADTVRFISDNNLDEVIAKGTVGDAVVTIIEGTQTVTFRDWYGTDNTYKSVTAREWLYGGVTYLLVVNTSYDPIKVDIDYIPNGKYRNLFDNSTVTATSKRVRLSLGPLEPIMLVLDQEIAQKDGWRANLLSSVITAVERLWPVLSFWR